MIANPYEFNVVIGGTRERPDFKLIHMKCQHGIPYLFTSVGALIEDMNNHQCPQIIEKEYNVHAAA